MPDKIIVTVQPFTVSVTDDGAIELEQEQVDDRQEIHWPKIRFSAEEIPLLIQSLENAAAEVHNKKSSSGN